MPIKRCCKPFTPLWTPALIPEAAWRRRMATEPRPQQTRSGHSVLEAQEAAAHRNSGFCRNHLREVEGLQLAGQDAMASQ